MASARSIITPGATPFKQSRRRGQPTETDKAVVAQVVQSTPAEITPSQITGLAKALNRTPAMIKKLVADARENFVASAGDYVAIHKQATQMALANGDAKSLDVAVKASQWAVQNIAADGQRVIDKADSESSGARIQIGIVLGAARHVDRQTPGVIDAE